MSSFHRSCALALLTGILLSSCGDPLQAAPAEAKRPQVEIKDGRWMVDGERFIVRGIGYEPGAHPGQYPKQRQFEPEAMTQDLRRIRKAGFNTVRCWDGYSDAELSLIEKEGLWVIQGIEVDWKEDLSNPEVVRKSLQHIDRIVKPGLRHGNILMYLVMNEPATEAILKTGEPRFLDFLRILRDRVHELHPGVPVSFSNTCIGEFLDPAPWDAVAFNLYMYGPVTVKNILGYRGYVEWMRKRIPSSIPLVVTEYGLSVSPAGEGRFGYGGNSPQDQAEGDLWMLQSLLEAGAEGSCVFSYSDSWWKNADKPNDADTHDNEPEEWYGLVGYESKADKMGTPRPAFEAMRKANQALWIQPVSWKEYRDDIPVEVYSTDDVDEITASTTTGTSVPLKREGKWWRASLPATGLGPTETIMLVTRSKTEEISRQNRTIVTDWSKVSAELRPVEFSLDKVPNPIPVGAPIPVVIRASSAQGAPIAKRSFKIGYYPHDGWAPGRSFDARSDQDGRISLNLDALPNPGVITLSISTGHEPLKDRPTWGDAFILRVGSENPK